MCQWDPRDYEQHASEQRRWARELVAGLGLRGDERILDIGCGDGAVTAEIAAMVPGGRVVGLDSSAAMVAHACSRHAAGAHPALSFVTGDARRLPFDAEFDLVVSFACLHWVDDHAAVLGGIRRTLVPGGRLLLQFGGRGNAQAVVEVIDVLTREPAWRGFFEGFRFPYTFPAPDEYRGLMLAAGLTPSRVELVHKDMRHGGGEGLAGWIRTTWLPYLERLPAERREEFVAAVVDRYVAGRPPQRDGAVIVPMVRLEVEGSR